MEYDDSAVHNFFRPLIRSGMGLGAQRWLATLQRQCECLAVIMSSSMPTTDNSGQFCFNINVIFYCKFYDL